jgi:hypothetical protein
MESTTIYFETNDSKKMRFFWMIQSLLGLVWLIQGVIGFYNPPDHLPWFHWVQFLGGIGLLIALAYYFAPIKKNDPPHLVLSDDGLRAKVKLRGQTRQFSWQEIGQINLKTSEIEVIPKSPDMAPLHISPGSYQLNQQVKQSLRSYASTHKVEVTG